MAAKGGVMVSIIHDRAGCRTLAAGLCVTYLSLAWQGARYGKQTRSDGGGNITRLAPRLGDGGGRRGSQGNASTPEHHGGRWAWFCD